MGTARTSELAHLRGRVKKLVDELGEMRNLVIAMRDHVEKADAQIERSNEIIKRRIEDFEIMLADKGGEWKDGLIGRYNDLTNEYNKLVKKWNRHVVSLKANRPIGRRLQASEAQQVHVRKLRKAGHILRDIAHETNLSIQTVRTIIKRKEGVDRPNKKRNEPRKNEISCERTISWRPGERARDTLADQIKILQEGKNLLRDGHDLLKK
jgi:DNA-binding MarR family transcriptional regulator